MLAAAAPATRKHTSARMVIVLVKQGSVGPANRSQPSSQMDIN
jgi:hypothetical protein